MSKSLLKEQIDYLNKQLELVGKTIFQAEELLPTSSPFEDPITKAQLLRKRLYQLRCDLGLIQEMSKNWAPVDVEVDDKIIE